MKYAPLETSIEIPSKVFLLGEYFCLEGAPALLAAIQPKFKYLNKTDATLLLPASSPANRLLGVESLEQVQRIGAESGGLGASTADFLYAYSRAGLSGGSDLNTVWKKYRECSSPSKSPNVGEKASGVQPSGLDLCAQATGGSNWFWIEGAQRVSQRKAGFNFLQQGFSLHLFLAAHLNDRKTATHVELEKLNLDHRKSFCEWMTLHHYDASAIPQVEKNFPDWMSRVAHWSEKTGLEHSQTTELREIFGQLPAVLAVKGCGAGFSDVILVATDASSTSGIENLYKKAESLKLKSLGELSEILTSGWMEHSS